jgi:broad specificity phosphatase PhoE
MSGGNVVYVVRHGETAWSKTGQHTGRTDLALAEDGERQAQYLKERLSGLEVAHVFSSPLQRARKTGEIAGFGKRISILEDLTEWDYGAYEGLTSAGIRKTRPGWDLFRDGCPNGESPEQISARADRVIAHIRDLHADALLFSSGHILRVLAARWTQESVSQARMLALDPASVGMLGYEHGQSDPVIRLWNERPYLHGTPDHE